MTTSDLAKQLDTAHTAIYKHEALAYDQRRFGSPRGRRYHERELGAILHLLGPVSGLRVLDIPCGTGRIASALGTAGAAMIGGDLSREMLDMARGRAEGSIDLAQVNGRALPLPSDSVDIVVCIRFFHLLPPLLWPGFLDEMYRVLRPGGRLLLQLFNPIYGGGLAVTRQVWNRMRCRAQEHYVWPWRLGGLLDKFCAFSVTSFWLPGMGLISQERNLARLLFLLSEYPPVSWVAGPWMVLAHK